MDQFNIEAAISIHEFDQQILPGYKVSRSELQRVFNLVANPTDWKEQINAAVMMSADDVKLVRAAVEFFTATKATVNEICCSLHSRHVLVEVKAIGYRRGPAQ